MYVNSTAPENPNMKHTSMGTTRVDHSTVLVWETVEIQDPVSPCKRVTLCEPVQSFEATALLDQLQELGIAVREHKRIQARHYAALLSIK